MFSNHMRQKAVYWAKDSVNGFNEVTVGTPVEIKCRWEEKQLAFVDAEGKDVVSQAVVYADQALVIDGYLYLGKLSSLTAEQQADPTLLSNAHMIKGNGNSTSIQNVNTLYWYYL